MFRDPPAWSGTSGDPNDEQFGHVVEPTGLEDASDYEAVLVGEPYDGAVIGRRGAREGPAAIREALAGTKTHHFEAGPVGSVGDLGDLALPSESPDVAAVQGQVRDAMEAVYEAGTVPVCLGGDNSLSFANAAPLLEESLGVVSIDAHLDCREPGDGGPSSGTPYHQLHEAGLDAFAVVGARHFETSTRYVDYVEQRGGTVVTAGAVDRSLEAAVGRAREAVTGVDRVYLSVDVDVLDAPEAPGASAPTPGGISSRELFDLVYRLGADDRVAGFEVVECAPPLDTENRTARAAARTVAHFLAGHQADQVTKTTP